jgi:hypothetical protein
MPGTRSVFVRAVSAPRVLFSRDVPNFPQVRERRNQASREEILARVRAEFEELGGLNLTVPQAERLFGLRDDICVRVLDALAREGLLCRSPNNRYLRR